MERITQKHLDGAINRLNNLLGRPKESYTKDANGKYTANPGNFHFSCAYGGVQLVEMCNEGGGVHSYGGYGTKRECYDRIYNMIKGVEVQQERNAV